MKIVLFFGLFIVAAFAAESPEYTKQYEVMKAKVMAAETEWTALSKLFFEWELQRTEEARQKIINEIDIKVIPAIRMAEIEINALEKLAKEPADHMAVETARRGIRTLDRMVFQTEGFARHGGERPGEVRRSDPDANWQVLSRVVEERMKEADARYEQLHHWLEEHEKTLTPETRRRVEQGLEEGIRHLKETERRINNIEEHTHDLRHQHFLEKVQEHYKLLEKNLNDIEARLLKTKTT